MGAGEVAGEPEAALRHRHRQRDQPYRAGGDRAPYRAVERLLGYVVSDWNRLDGTLALEGVDIRRLDLRRLCNVVYAWLTRDADAEAIREFDRDLEFPFDWELTEFELRREQARRLAKQTGAFRGQAAALEAMRGPRGKQPMPGAVR